MDTGSLRLLFRRTLQHLKQSSLAFSLAHFIDRCGHFLSRDCIFYNHASPVFRSHNSLIGELYAFYYPLDNLSLFTFYPPLSIQFLLHIAKHKKSYMPDSLTGRAAYGTFPVT